MVDELHTLERSLGAAYASAGRLSSKLVAAQMEAGLSSVAGHQIMSAISNASVGISGAITSSAKGHAALERIGRRHGYDPTQWGDGTKDPGPGFFETGRNRFEVAA